MIDREVRVGGVKWKMWCVSCVPKRIFTGAFCEAAALRSTQSMRGTLPGRGSPKRPTLLTYLHTHSLFSAYSTRFLIVHFR